MRITQPKQVNSKHTQSSFACLRTRPGTYRRACAATVDVGGDVVDLSAVFISNNGALSSPSVSSKDHPILRKTNT